MKVFAPGVLEGQTATRDLVASCDVCVVGSGPGGATAARTFQQAGLSVVVLEEGGYFTKDRFRLREDEAFPHLYQDGAQRTTKDLAVTILQGKAVGGGTVVNWTTCFRTPDDVIEHWRGVHDVGGFTGADLAPHFDEVERLLHVTDVPLESVNRNNRTLYDGCRALGVDVSLLRRNVKNCAQTGGCGLGCPVDAKQSTAVTLLPDAMRAGATVVSRCRVERIEHDGARATAVVGALLDAQGLAPTGVRVRIEPRFVVVSAGAIGSPALLLRSRAPDPHGRLGLRTFLHPVVMSAAEFDEPVEGWYGAPQSVASHQFAHRGDEVGYFLEAAPVYPLLAATLLPGFGVEANTTLRRLAHFAAHIGITIDGFHDDVPGGRVTLSPSGAPVVDYPLADRTWRALREAQKQLARIALAAGARRVMTLHDPPLVLERPADVDRIDGAPYEPCRLPVASAHQMGGCGMSDDPKKGVVRSEDLRHHQVENLHVLDGSVFPTSLGVNPQVSIFGLTRLAATRLVEKWKRA